MENSVIDLYVREIISQAEAAQIALGTLSYYQTRDPRIAHSACIALLGSTAIISKMLSGDPPPSPRPSSTDEERAAHAVQAQYAARRGAALRDIYKRGGKKITVLNERAVRNGFEHIDNRIDRYHLDSSGKSLILRSLVNGRSNVFGDGVDDFVFMGVIDFMSGSIIMLDDEISIARLQVAVDFILERSTEWQNQHMGS